MQFTAAHHRIVWETVDLPELQISAIHAAQYCPSAGRA
jgi:hypothetical protein